MARALLENGGGLRISALAELLGRHRGDKALRAAVERAVGEGYYKLEGSTSDRRLVRKAPLRFARICSHENPRCTVREFGRLDWLCPSHGVAVDQCNRPYDDPRVAWPG